MLRACAWDARFAIRLSERRSSPFHAVTLSTLSVGVQREGERGIICCARDVQSVHYRPASDLFSLTPFIKRAAFTVSHHPHTKANSCKKNSLINAANGFRFNTAQWMPLAGDASAQKQNFRCLPVAIPAHSAVAKARESRLWLTQLCPDRDAFFTWHRACP